MAGYGVKIQNVCAGFRQSPPVPVTAGAARASRRRCQPVPVAADASPCKSPQVPACPCMAAQGAGMSTRHRAERGIGQKEMRPNAGTGTRK